MYKIFIIKDGKYCEIKDEAGKELIFKTEDEAALFLQAHSLRNTFIAYIEREDA
ncbi:MAG: hypothetical protein IBX72_11405 [Nitrospirae bacterium]|nr:hypothetical protein [Nitrospirota bacterium]